jgi:hypothetical protein
MDWTAHSKQMIPADVSQRCLVSFLSPDAVEVRGALNSHRTAMKRRPLPISRAFHAAGARIVKEALKDKIICLPRVAGKMERKGVP